MSTKQQSVSGATFKAYLLTLPVKIVELPQQHANTHLVVSPSDEALRKFLSLPIVAKSSILNVAEFVDPPLKTLPYIKTSPVSCETSLFSYYFEMWPTLSKVIVFLCYFLQYDEVFLTSLLDGCYHYLVFINPVNGYSKLQLPVKKQVSLKSKIRLTIYVSCNFFYPSFVLSSSAHLLMFI